ncbi:MAG: OsmC family peroxiredoxin, partial [Chloroflexi bacterium]|nr:OsmC family peroxiredoxin [Chloroflexota bacterium]
RTAKAEWRGDLRSGGGEVDTESGALVKVPYSFGTRFGDQRGANPEELIAAAHAACFAMAFANTLSQKGHKPQSVQVQASCILSRKEEGGFAITGMDLEAKVRAPSLSPGELEAIAKEAEAGCPVSNVLRPGLEIRMKAELAS